MKNITVSVDDETYRRARIKAAERETSVSGMVREFLNRVAGEDSEFERLARQERELRKKIKGFSAADRLPHALFGRSEPWASDRRRADRQSFSLNRRGRSAQNESSSLNQRRPAATSGLRKAAPPEKRFAGTRASTSNRSGCPIAASAR